MANNQSSQISRSSNAYDPNNLSLFPELLQPVHPDVANQELQPPAVHPEHFGGENARRQPTGIDPHLLLVVAQRVYYGESNNELVVLQQGTGGTSNQTTSHILPTQRTISRPTPRPIPNIYPAPRTGLRPTPLDLFPIMVPTRRRSAAISRAQPSLVTTSNIYPGGRLTDSRPTPDILPVERTILRPTPRRISNTHPAGRTGPRRDLDPSNVTRRIRSPASSRAQVQNTYGPTLDVPNIPAGEASAVPAEGQVEATISNCSVCMNPFSDPTAAKCGHVFCRICINNAYERQGRCPLCRKNINMRDLLRIYLS